MQVDALLARRTQAEVTVVHGINLLLWAFDSLASAQSDLPPLRSFSAQFNKFVYLGEYVELLLTQQGLTGARLNLSVDNALRSEVTIEFGDAVEGLLAWADSSLAPKSPLPAALDLSLEQMLERSGNLAFRMTVEQAATLFPAATKWLGAQRIMALAASTYLGGMVCFGLHSIYSELLIKTCAESDSVGFLAFRMTKTCPRLRLVKREIPGGRLTGTVRSFVRTPPTASDYGEP